MPFGIDPKQIEKAAQDIADVKLQQAVMDAKLDQILASVNNHGMQKTEEDSNGTRNKTL
jgi:hypothetical protein